MRKKKQNNRGGTKITLDGITFKSKLEVYCYKQLIKNDLEANYETITFELLPAITFKYNDKKTKIVRPMTYTPDFVGPNFIIECKGHPNGSFPVKWKVFKHFLYNSELEYYLFLPRNIKDVDKTIKKIIELNKKKLKCIYKKQKVDFVL